MFFFSIFCWIQYRVRSCIGSTWRFSLKHVEKCGPFLFFCFCFFSGGAGRGLNVELDPCLSNPCLNRGECIQLRFGRYKCECTGTNFFGEKCQIGKIRVSWTRVMHKFRLVLITYQLCRRIWISGSWLVKIQIPPIKFKLLGKFWFA